MASKTYYGRCGTCRYCDLSSGYTFCNSTSFRCTRNNYSVKADEKPCNRYECDRSRSTEIIARYDK